jgi:CRISPR system Cascade subunit CasA
VPVRLQAGGGELRVGLRELFVRAHEIEDLALPIPPAASGLWRVLYAVTARITGLDDPKYLDDGGRLAWLAERRKYFGKRQFDADRVAEYFVRFGAEFDLFGAGGRPFLQDSRLVAQCPKASGVNKLVFLRPAGNNHAWWSHTFDDRPVALEPAQAAWWLLAQLFYGASGRCSTRTVGGQSSASTKAGPLRGAISFHPLGENLFESLLAGLPGPSSADDADLAADTCPWEVGEPDPSGPARRVTWPGALLTGRARHAVLLVPSQDGREVVNAYLTWGDTAPVDVFDPYVVLNTAQKDGSLYTRPASLERALWRDLDALFLEDQTGRTRRPAVFADLDYLPRGLASRLRVRAFGFDQDGQATDKQYFTAVTAPVFKYAQGDGGARMRRCREDAERVGRQLASAARTAWQESGEGIRARTDQRSGGPWVARALANYWPHAEQVFWELLARSDDDRVPVSVFVESAVRALEDAVGSAESDQRAARALTHARALLYSLRPKKDPKNPTAAGKVAA